MKEMQKNWMTIGLITTLAAAALTATANPAQSMGHYGQPHSGNRSNALLAATENDNLDVVNHDPFNTYNVSIPGWSGTLYTNPSPNQPDPPSCSYCQYSTYIQSWPTTIDVNGTPYIVPQHGPITYFDIYPPSHSFNASNGTSNKPRIVIH